MMTSSSLSLSVVVGPHDNVVDVCDVIIRESGVIIRPTSLPQQESKNNTSTQLIERIKDIRHSVNIFEEFHAKRLKAKSEDLNIKR